METNEMIIEFDSKSQNEGFARLVIAAFVAQLDPTIEEIADIKTAVSEAVTNCIIHGYENKSGKIMMIGRIHGNEIYIEILTYHEYGKDKYEKEHIINQIKQCITNKSKYTYHWNKKYDNSIELSFNDEYYRAWYSEEYKGYCNGYYYFMLNETHAIFGEKD